MKGKIAYSLKSPLTKRSSDVDYWKLNEMPGSSECLGQKHQFLNFWGKTIWGNYGKRVKTKWERRVSNRWNHMRKKVLLLMVESRERWTLKPKLWRTQIWTLINNFIIVLVCAKCSKLITLEENMISVGIKYCFDGVFFQDPVFEECFSTCLQCLHL